MASKVSPKICIQLGKISKLIDDVNLNEVISVVWTPLDIEEREISSIIERFFIKSQLSRLAFENTDQSYFRVHDDNNVPLVLPPKTTIIIYDDESFQCITDSDRIAMVNQREALIIMLEEEVTE